MHLTDDIVRRLQREAGQEIDFSLDTRLERGLQEIQIILRQAGKSLRDFGIDDPPEVVVPGQDGVDRLEREHIALQAGLHGYDINVAVASLNPQQRTLVDNVLHHLREDPQFVFVDAPGGTGKTHAFNVLLNAARSEGMYIFAVASSGLAALNLAGGRTGHSQFEIPVPCDEDSICNIKRGSALARMLIKAKGIIWDEGPMHHRHVYECLSRSLIDIRRDERPFGGLTMIMGGDFRQTLPIVVRGTRAQVVSACMKRSPLWANVKVYRLEENMRLRRPAGEHDEAKLERRRAWAHWLLDVGNGIGCAGPAGIATLDMPPALTLHENNTEGLIEHVYGDIDRNPVSRSDYFSARAILCARNQDVAIINDMISTGLIRDDSKCYLSADQLDSVTGASSDDLDRLYPPEFIRGIVDWSIPPHELKLAHGTPVMLLRNLSQTKGLCNGTRLVVKRHSKYALECEIITGPQKGAKPLKRPLQFL